MATAKKTTSGAVIVQLPEIEFKTVTVKIKGTSPIVTHPFSKKAMLAIEQKQQQAAKTAKHEVRNPWGDFIESIYWLSPVPTEFTEEAFNKATENGRYGFHVGGVKKLRYYGGVPPRAYQKRCYGKRCVSNSRCGAGYDLRQTMP